MNRVIDAVDPLIKLYPPVPGCQIPSRFTGPEQQLVGMCYHHADLRARLVEGGPIDRFERLYLVRLELANRADDRRRRYRRYPVHLPATMHIDALTSPCIVTDVAPGGLGITTPQLPESLGSILVEFPGNPWLPTARFSVGWSQPVGRQLMLGLQFISVPEYVLPAPLRTMPHQCQLSHGIALKQRTATGCTRPTRASCACSHGAVPRSTTVAMTA